MDKLITIHNNDDLSLDIVNLSEVNTEDFVDFTLTLEKEGKEISKEKFSIEIEPDHNYWYYPEVSEDLENGEYVYTLEANAKKTLAGNKKGQLLASGQKIFNVTDKEEESKKKTVKMTVKETDTDISFTGEDFKFVFSKALGGLVELAYDGEDYLQSKPLVSFWRPLTDTDLRLGLQYQNAQWLGATVGQQLLPEKYYFEKEDDIYRLTFVYRYPLPGGIESAVIYSVKPDGSIDVETTYAGLATLDMIPTFAMEFKLNKNLNTFTYYGYGPDENYIDTTEGLNLNVYKSTVRKNFKKNLRPQETGNRTGVRWAEVYNNKTGKGLKFTANKGLIEFNALPYNSLEIEAAQTIEELPRTSASTNVRIAANVSGIGNGEFINDWAKIDAGEMIELKFNISFVTVK